MKNWYKAGPRDLIQKMADMMAEDQLTAFEAGAEYARQRCIIIARNVAEENSRPGRARSMAWGEPAIRTAKEIMRKIKDG